MGRGEVRTRWPDPDTMREAPEGVLMRDAGTNGRRTTCPDEGRTTRRNVRTKDVRLQSQKSSMRRIRNVINQLSCCSSKMASPGADERRWAAETGANEENYFVAAEVQS